MNKRISHSRRISFRKKYKRIFFKQNQLFQRNEFSTAPLILMIAASTFFNGRVVLIGDAAVGKTSILNQAMEHRFNETEPTTVGANYQLYSTDIDDIHVDIQIWDTAGEERFKSLGPIYFRNSIGAICVFDSTNRQSFNSLPEWIDFFKSIAGDQTVIAVVANKCDLTEMIQVSNEEAENFAHSNAYLFFRTSAKTGMGIQEMFLQIAKELVKTKTSVIEQPSPNPKQSGCSC